MVDFLKYTAQSEFLAYVIDVKSIYGRWTKGGGMDTSPGEYGDLRMTKDMTI